MGIEHCFASERKVPGIMRIYSLLHFYDSFNNSFFISVPGFLNFLDLITRNQLLASASSGTLLVLDNTSQRNACLFHMSSMPDRFYGSRVGGLLTPGVLCEQAEITGHWIFRIYRDIYL